MSPTAPDPITSEASEAAPAAPALVSLARLLGRAAAREWLRQQPEPTDEPEAGTPIRPETGR